MRYVQDSSRHPEAYPAFAAASFSQAPGPRNREYHQGLLGRYRLPWGDRLHVLVPSVSLLTSFALCPALSSSMAAISGRSTHPEGISMLETASIRILRMEGR